MVAHIQGGENSGSIDNCIRHAITKLANIHFVSNVDCAERIIKMGERKDSVHVTGCPTIDICLDLPDASVESTLKKYNLPKFKEFNCDNRYIIAAFHPVTTSYLKNKNDFLILLKVMTNINIQVIWLYPNFDAGSNFIYDEIKNFESKREYLEKTPPIFFFSHFSIEDYLLLLKKCSCIIGNSSVGIRESSFFGTPSVSIGNRQQMRQQGENVIVSDMNEITIRNKILYQIKHGNYQPTNLYGSGNSGKKIAQVLINCKISIKKKMTY